jgi:hypothetical protein
MVALCQSASGFTPRVATLLEERPPRGAKSELEMPSWTACAPGSSGVDQRPLDSNLLSEYVGFRRLLLRLLAMAVAKTSGTVRGL